MELIITNKKGSYVVVYDECDHDFIKSKKWYMGGDGYPRTAETKPKLMHRLLLGLSDPKIHCDHKNHIKSDNRRENLRICTHAQNMANMTPRGESKYLGVSYQRYTLRGRYSYCHIIASIWVAGKKKIIGRFRTEEEAAMAYDRVAFAERGEFANLNFKSI